MSRPQLPRPAQPAESVPESDEQSELRSYQRAFNAAPSFGTLRKLAELWSRSEHWELAAQAWLHVARARPGDVQALASAAAALSKLSQHELAARVWERACRIQPDNREYAAAHARAVRDSNSPLAQANSSLDRTGF